MPPKSKRPNKSKSSVPAAADGQDYNQAKLHPTVSGGSTYADGEEELADYEGPPRVSAVEGRSAEGDSVTRNLLPDLDEEALEDDRISGMEDVVDLTEAIEESAGSGTAGSAAEPTTPLTRAVNSVPIKMDPTVPQAVPARMIEVIMAKHEGLKYLRVSKVTAGADVRDPGFTSMKDRQQVLLAIIGVFTTAGYSVAVLDNTKILSVSRAKLVAGGQAIYDLFLRHQSQRKIEQAIGASRTGLIDADSLKTIAEQYIGRSREDVKQLEEDLMLKDKMLKDMETYLQDFADRVAAEKAAATAALAQVASVEPIERSTQPIKAETKANIPTRPDRKDFFHPKFTAATTSKTSTDYLADIYDECVGSAPSVNAASRLRQAATADLKSFDGRSRDEFRGRSHLSSVRAAFRLDGLTPGEACLHFPETLTDRAKIWYRQLAKAIRADWKRLQSEFEHEYCGGTATPHQRYYEMRRKPNEEPIDYLYRLNVQAIEAGIEFHDADGPSHVTHFIDTCEDPDLARQFGLMKPSTEAIFAVG